MLPIDWNGDRYECISKWKKDQLIGKGLYGRVYEACCDENCDYIMKVVEFRDNDEFGFNYSLENLKREIEIQRELAHAGVAPIIYDAWKTKTHGFIIMEQLDETLENKIDKMDYIDKVIDKVKIMHQLGIIHGDLHLGNIMLTKHGEIRIIDFGSGRKFVIKREIFKYLTKFWSEEKASEYIDKGDIDQRILDEVKLSVQKHDYIVLNLGLRDSRIQELAK